MSEERHWFEKLTLALENHKRGVQYGAYSIAVVGLAVALRSVRPFQRFVSPKDIPASFIESQMRLKGRVIRVDPSSDIGPTTLIIEHYPIISLRRSSDIGLPVQIASVDLSSNAISWLQHVAVEKDVDFTLLKTNPNFVSCIVHLKSRNLGMDLVSLGFASVSAIEFSLEKDPNYLKYYKGLLAAESKAEKKGVGMWARELTNYQVVTKFVFKLTRPMRTKLGNVNFQFLKKRLALF